MRIKILVSSLIIGFNLVLPIKNMACPIPVFRYALEFWEADPYRLEIIYSNSLSHKEKELADYLQRVSEGKEVTSNIKIRTVDIESADHDIPQSILKDLAFDKGAYIVLRYPFVSGINIALWSAALNKENIHLLLDSPIRKSIATKLTSNATAVWIFLESGNHQKDNEALDLLNRELKRLEQTLTLADVELWLDNYQGGSDNIPRIKFEVISLSRDDPSEEYLVNMLLYSEADLMDFDKEPIVFPIYGRGIILYGIVGKGINEWNIREAADFITGPCSCQAKLLNPGIDMLITVNWDKQIQKITDPGIANPLTGIGDFSDREEEARRLLEEATMKRLGTKGKETANPESDRKKVIYLDISGDEEQKNENTNNGDEAISSDSKSKNNKTFVSKYQHNNNKQEKREKEERRSDNHDDLSEKDSSDIVIMNYKSTKGLSSSTFIFGGIVLIILLGGVILYMKTTNK